MPPHPKVRVGCALRLRLARCATGAHLRTLHSRLPVGGCESRAQALPPAPSPHCSPLPSLRSWSTRTPRPRASLRRRAALKSCCGGCWSPTARRTSACSRCACSRPSPWRTRSRRVGWSARGWGWLHGRAPGVRCGAVWPARGRLPVQRSAAAALQLPCSCPPTLTLPPHPTWPPADRAATRGGQGAGAGGGPPAGPHDRPARRRRRGAGQRLLLPGGAGDDGGPVLRAAHGAGVAEPGVLGGQAAELPPPRGRHPVFGLNPSCRLSCPHPA